MLLLLDLRLLFEIQDYFTISSEKKEKKKKKKKKEKKNKVAEH